MDLKKSIHSGNIVKQAPGGDPRVLRFIASNESPDRDNDIIDSAGWNLQNFNKNPVFLWAHDYSTPSIGKVIHCEKDVRNKQLIADVRFPTMAEMAPDGNPSEHAKFVETIFNLYKNGYLNAVSVGCKYLKYEQRSDGAEASKEMYNRGIHVMEAELWELSGCPVPSNQDAMLQASALPGVEKSALDIVIKSIKTEENKPKEKAAIPFKHYPLADEDTAWDGPKVIADSDIEDLKVICTWVDSEKKPEDLTKGDFSLPHHMAKADGYKTVKRGVVAAVGALMGARGGVSIPEKDVEKVKAHLRKHYDELELEWPEEKSAWIEQAKSIGIIEKEGRRLSAATLSMIDDLEDGMKEMDEAIEAMKKCRDGMSARIAGLRNGYSEEPGNDDTDGKKGIIEIIPDVAIEIAD